MKGRSVLISGVGIAGPALAYWLLRCGFEPTLVEQAPSLRDDGYVIDFWGIGYDIVERMGLLPAVLDAGYSVREVRIVDDSGGRVGGFDASVFREAAHGRYTSLPRARLGVFVRNQVSKTLAVPFVAQHVLRGFLRDDIELPRSPEAFSQ